MKTFFILLLLWPVVAFGQNPAITVEEYGAIRDSQSSNGERPNDVRLDGNLRSMDLSTPLGEVLIRWPRSVEQSLGLRPDKSVRDAWIAASRALASGFPTRLRSASYHWNMVFMDAVPGNVDPSGLGGSCHPAWMRPPADIFVAAERIASRCGTQRLSPKEISAELAEVLVHELGHAVEFQFADKGFGRMQRWHSEGFASWFESRAMQYLPGGGSDRKTSRAGLRLRAKVALTPNWRPSHFQGASEDYARGYAMIAVIAEGKSITRLVDVYKRMSKENVDLITAVQKELSWNEEKWVAEAIKFLK